MASSLTLSPKPDSGWVVVVLVLIAVGLWLQSLFFTEKGNRLLARIKHWVERQIARLMPGGGYKTSTPAIPAPNQPLKEETEHSFSDSTRRPCMREAVDAIAEDNLRDLVRDRLEEVSRRVEDWVMEVADALGELEDLKTEDADDARRVRDVCTELRRELSALDCEILDSDVWNPETQRAVKVENTLPPGSTPSITQKVSYGLRVQGRLVRKQEVCLQK